MKQKFTQLFETNMTIKHMEKNIQLKADFPLIKQKARPFPYYSQKHVQTKINGLTRRGRFEKLEMWMKLVSYFQL